MDIQVNLGFEKHLLFTPWQHEWNTVRQKVLQMFKLLNIDSLIYLIVKGIRIKGFKSILICLNLPNEILITHIIS